MVKYIEYVDTDIFDIDTKQKFKFLKEKKI